MSRSVLASLMIAVLGCGGGELGGPTGDHESARAVLLRETVSSVILPGYRAVETRATALHTRTRELCDGSPDAVTVTAARDAWRELFLAWERTEAFQFGPTRDLNLGNELAFFPTRTTTVESNIRGTNPLDEAGVEALGASGLGVFALEYLLYEPADASAVAAALAATPRRCTYLVAAAAHAVRLAARLVSEWTPYGEAMATAALAGNTTFPMQARALALLVSQMRATVVSIQANRLGVPLGDASAGNPRPREVRSRFAGLSNEGMLAEIEGVRATWTATADPRALDSHGGSHGLGAYLATRNALLAAAVLEQITALEAALQAIPRPLENYVVLPEHPLATQAQQAARALERTLGTDVAAALSISVVFTDADGD